MKRDEINAWIMARKAEGLWVRTCLSCGSWFAQEHKGRPGIACDRKVCIAAYRWQRRYGRMPPDWVWAMFRAKYGDATRGTHSLRCAA